VQGVCSLVHACVVFLLCVFVVSSGEVGPSVRCVFGLGIREIRGWVGENWGQTSILVACSVEHCFVLFVVLALCVRSVRVSRVVKVGEIWLGYRFYSPD
jgi:hypothetical protein